MDLQKPSHRHALTIISTVLLTISSSSYGKNLDVQDAEILDDDDDECKFNCDDSAADTRNYILLGLLLLLWVVAVAMLRWWCIRKGMFSGRGRRRRESRQNIVSAPVPPYQYQYPTARSATELNNNGQQSLSIIDLPPPSYPMQEYNTTVDANLPTVDSTFNNAYPLVEEPPPSYYEVASSTFQSPEVDSSISHGEKLNSS